MSYSQYHTYGQNVGGAGSTTTVAGQQWNGTAWVPAASVVNPTTHSTYSSASSPYATMGTCGPSAATTSSSQSGNFVATYTQYYHQWHNRALEQRKLAERLVGTEKEEALRQAQWADYYADQSSRAAYHYAGSAGVQTTATVPPPVPPAPPQAAAPAPQPEAAPKSSRWDSVPPAATTPSSTNKHDAPGGLKQYVHRCLARCDTKEERQLVQKKVEKVIAKVIQDGTMHTTNWDNVELVDLERDSHQSTPVARPAKKARTETQTNNYYGGSHDKSYDSKLPENDSYYGRGSYSEGTQKRNGNKEGQYRKSSSHRHDYEDKLPLNDSYYGNSSPAPIVQNSHSPRSEKTNKPGPAKDSNYYGPSSNAATDFEGGNFVSLSHSSRKKTAKKKSSKDAVKKLAQSDGFERSSTALAKRANRFSRKGSVSHAASISVSEGENTHRYMGMAVIGGGNNKKLDETDYEHMTVKGTCQTLTKEYLRLTAPPRAELVRPQPVLKQHLCNLKQEWDQPKEKKRDYIWFCSQLKAVRQDLTVQRINNEFAVDAYETHARIALQEGDLNEYNQCQTQLKELYDSHHSNGVAVKNLNEFMAYRIVYYVFLTGNKKYEGGSSDLFKIMLSLTPKQRDDPCIRHALKVRVAVAEYDYHSFFRLQDSCPKLGAFLMDFMVPNVRYWALQRICKAYRPSVPVAHVLQELSFDPDDAAQLEEGKQWLKSCGCVLSDDGKTLQCKESAVRESDLATKSSLI